MVYAVSCLSSFKNLERHLDLGINKVRNYSPVPTINNSIKETRSRKLRLLILKLADVFQQSASEIRVALADLSSPKLVVEYILKLKEEKKIQVICLLWTWWSERNRIREGENRRTVANLAHGIHIYSLEILRVLEKEKKPRSKSTSRWTRPDTGVLKINCDASIMAVSGTGGWGYD
ncbi:hypothetical protein EJB05_28299, partial [Eragrostis curvula]